MDVRRDELWRPADSLVPVAPELTAFAVGPAQGPTEGPFIELFAGRVDPAVALGCERLGIANTAALQTERALRAA